MNSNLQVTPINALSRLTELGGKWKGYSIPYANASDFTTWDFELTITNTNISGSGESVFRGEKINFTINGSFLDKPVLIDGTYNVAVELSKTHTGNYQNTINYQGCICLNTFTIKGTFKSGKILLKKGSSWFYTQSFENHQPIENPPLVEYPPFYPTDLLNPLSNPTIQETSIQETSIQETSIQEITIQETSAREKYEIFLNGLLSDGSLNNKKILKIQQFRTEYGVNDNDHVAVLNELGISPQVLTESIKKSDEDLKEELKNESNDSNDQCIICYGAKIDCIFMPCGHLISCMTCAKRVEKCPGCVVSITNVVRVFKM